MPSSSTQQKMVSSSPPSVESWAIAFSPSPRYIFFYQQRRPFSLSLCWSINCRRRYFVWRLYGGEEEPVTDRVCSRVLATNATSIWYVTISGKIYIPIYLKYKYTNVVMMTTPLRQLRLRCSHHASCDVEGGKRR
jgi:hypothetical protein